MFKQLTLAAFALAIAAPAFAMDPTPAEARLAAKLDLEPGRYTLGELTRISLVSGAERRDVIRIINKKHERFAEQVEGVIAAGGDPMDVLVTRDAQ